MAPTSGSSIPPLPIGKGLGSVGATGLKANQQGGALFSTMAANASNNNGVSQVQSLSSNDKILLKRIKDLEAQNERLRKHVGQAEDAIRNYRGFMSARSESAGDDTSKNNDKSSQTIDPVDVMQALQNELKELRRKLMAAEKSNERLTLQQAKKADSSVRKVTTADTSTSINNDKAVLELQLELEELRARCEQKDREGERMRKQNDAERAKRLNMGSAMNKLLNAAREIKSGFQTEKRAVEEELGEYQCLLQDNVRKLQEADRVREMLTDEKEDPSRISMPPARNVSTDTSSLASSTLTRCPCAHSPTASASPLTWCNSRKNPTEVPVPSH